MLSRSLLSLFFLVSFIRVLSPLHSRLSPRCVLPLGQACVLVSLCVRIPLVKVEIEFARAIAVVPCYSMLHSRREEQAGQKKYFAQGELPVHLAMLHSL